MTKQDEDYDKDKNGCGTCEGCSWWQRVWQVIGYCDNHENEEHYKHMLEEGHDKCEQANMFK